MPKKSHWDIFEKFHIIRLSIKYTTAQLTVKRLILYFEEPNFFFFGIMRQRIWAKGEGGQICVKKKYPPLTYNRWDII